MRILLSKKTSKEDIRSYRKYCADIPQKKRVKLAIEMSHMAMKMNKKIHKIINNELKGSYVLRK
jgi:hypothetical protein